MKVNLIELAFIARKKKIPFAFGLLQRQRIRILVEQKKHKKRVMNLFKKYGIAILAESGEHRDFIVSSENIVK